MAIVYVGGQSGGRTNPTAALPVNFALTGGIDTLPRTGDLVVVTCVTGSAGGNPAMAIVTPTGYWNIGNLNPNTTTADTSLDVSMTRMGATPDTQLTIPGTTNNAWGEGYAIQVFRGVWDQYSGTNAPSATGASGTATGRPDPGSVTPSIPGCWIVCCGGGAIAGTGANYVAPANYINMVTNFGADSTDGMVGMCYRSDWSSGSEDPATYTGGTTGATDSWACYTIILNPEPEKPEWTRSVTNTPLRM